MPLHVITTTDRHGSPVNVEAHVAMGLPSFTVIGASLGADRERRDRLRAAVLNSGLAWPQRCITVNVAPIATRGRTTDPGLDLAIALGIMAAAGNPDAALHDTAERAELGLDGSVRPR